MRLWRFNSPGLLQVLICFRAGALGCAEDSYLFVTGASSGHPASPGAGEALTDLLP